MHSLSLSITTCTTWGGQLGKHTLLGDIVHVLFPVCVISLCVGVQVIGDVVRLMQGFLDRHQCSLLKPAPEGQLPLHQALETASGAAHVLPSSRS